MAHRKKNKKIGVRYHPRARVGGVGNEQSRLLGLAAGSVASALVDKLLEKVKITDKKFKAAAKAGAAIFLLPKLSRSPMIKAVGDGMIAFSALQLAADLGLYRNGAGIGEGPDVYVDMQSLSGLEDTIQGEGTFQEEGLGSEYLPSINGMDEDDQN